MAQKIFLNSKGFHTLTRGTPYLISNSHVVESGSAYAMLPVGAPLPLSYQDRVVGYGALNGLRSVIQIWSRPPGGGGGDNLPPAPVDDNFIKTRVQRSYAYRSQWHHALGGARTTAYRLIHSYADGFPGVVVDQYAENNLVIALSTPAAEYIRTPLLKALKTVPLPFSSASLHSNPPLRIWERSDSIHDGMVKPRAGLIDLRTGDIRVNDDTPAEVEILEDGRRYLVNILLGHKTGFYLDQAQNRSTIQQISAGRRVLDLCCYTGGFTIAALLGGAKHVTAVDFNEGNLKFLLKNLAVNDIDPTNKVALRKGDVFDVLKHYKKAGEEYDLVILDPPKLSSTSKDPETAFRALRGLNSHALSLLAPDGLLATFSCSSATTRANFSRMMRLAVEDFDYGSVTVLRHFNANIDHPVLTSYPEGEYLTGLLVQRTDIPGFTPIRKKIVVKPSE